MLCVIKLIILGISQVILINTLNNNAKETSSKTRIIKISKFDNSYEPKDNQNKKDSIKNYLDISFEHLITQGSKNISSQDVKNHIKAVIVRFVSEILTKTLKDENIFLLYDRELLNQYMWFEFLLYNNLRKQAHIAQEIQEFDLNYYDAKIVSGYKYVTICLIYNHNVLLDLFLNKTTDYKWSPKKLIIVYLDHQSVLSEQIFDSSIQRSKYIFIAELAIKKNKTIFQMYSIYPFQRNKTVFPQWKIFMGIYTIPIRINEILVERNKKFRGKALNLASICDDYPHLYQDKSGKCVGVNIEILQIISKVLNFKFNIQNYTEDGLWAGTVNNEFVGMFKDLYHNDKDLIINFSFMDYISHKYFDSSFPFMFDGFGFLNAIPGPAPAWKKIFLPFSDSLWILLLLTIIALITIIFFMMKFGLKSRNNSWFSTSFILVVGIMFRQNVNLKNKKIWFLSLLAVWIIGAFIMMSAYSGNLISFMTFPSSKKRIETVKELINSKLRVAKIFFGVSFTEEILHSPIEDFRIIGKRIDSFPNTDHGLARIKELVIRNHHVFLDAYMYLFHFQKTFNITDQTYVMKEKIWEGYYSFIFKKHSQLTNPISCKLNRLIETGIYSRILEKHLKKMKRVWENNDQSNRQELKLEHVQTAFYGLLLGYSMSLLILLLEIVINRHEK